MSTDDDKVIRAVALEFAFFQLVRTLEEAGVIPRGEVARKITTAGTDLVMTSHLDSTRAIGREMAELAKRLS